MRFPALITCSLILLGACNNSDSQFTSLTHVTRMVVSPSEFLGNLSCGVPGGMQRYQATLFDVTEGLDRAFQLPSSPVIDCTSDVNFEYVQEGHRYVATVVGFDVTGIRSQNPGSSVVVDKQGQPVDPRWTTTCWGTEESRETYGGGGAGPSSEGLGGAEDVEGLGAIAYQYTEIVVRGCDPLLSEAPPAKAAVVFDLDSRLLGLSCGDSAADVSSYEVRLISTDSSDLGGQGGGGVGAGETRQGPCGKTLLFEAVPADDYIDFEVIAMDGEGEPGWISSCVARTRPQATVSAICESFVEL